MNWQTKQIFKEAKDTVSDEGVFTADQVAALTDLVSKIEEAVEKESTCIGSGIRHTS